MEKDKIYEALQPERIKLWLNNAFAEADIYSEELLNDTQKIEKAASIAYKKIPLFPYRAIIKATIGEKGFQSLVFKIRNKMLEAKSLDLSWLNIDFLKSILSK